MGRDPRGECFITGHTVTRRTQYLLVLTTRLTLTLSKTCYRLVMLVMLSPLLSSQAIADSLSVFNTLANAGYVYADSDGRVIEGIRIDEPFIPASTTKLVTAWMALKHWGEDHRFGTEIHLHRDSGKLWIKGNGDPFLVSEEIELIAAKIAQLNPLTITGVVLDSTLFEADLVVPGATTTNNPYDAVPSAIAANFNTIYLKKSGGSVISAEAQTPLTAFSRSFANEITGASLRINTGRQSKHSERYFAELLISLLRRKGITVEDEISWGEFPESPTNLIHYNSRTLGEVVQAMLKYSTNFIANQLVLSLYADRSGSAANFDGVQRMMQTDLKTYFKWRDFAFLEGAGLSVNNRISARQLLDLVIEFKPWMHLLDEVEPTVFAKTGTLTNVSTLAGFVKDTGKLNPFVILINQGVPAGFARALATELSAR